MDVISQSSKRIKVLYLPQSTLVNQRATAEADGSSQTSPQSLPPELCLPPPVHRRSSRAKAALQSLSGLLTPPPNSPCGCRLLLNKRNTLCCQEAQVVIRSSKRGRPRAQGAAHAFAHRRSSVFVLGQFAARGSGEHGCTCGINRHGLSC